MRASSTIPSMLEDFIDGPQDFPLALITSVLGTSPAWLFLHLLNSAFNPGQGKQANHVVLISFMRDWDFWRESASKMGFDLRGLSKERFKYIDWFSCRTDTTSTKGALNIDHQLFVKPPESKAILESISRELGEVRKAASSDGNIILLVDQPDLLLAAEKDLGSIQLQNEITNLCEQATTVIISAATDLPLLHHPVTDLEMEHAAFVTGLAHQSTALISLRPLQTGIAKEVSGVLRMTGEIGKGEWLYQIRSDFGVKLWGRGEQETA